MAAIDEKYDVYENTCSTCYAMGFFDRALNDADRILFTALSSPIIAFIAGIMTIVLLFHVQINAHLRLFDQPWSQTALFQEFYRNIGRMTFAAFTLSSYYFWHDWVVGSVNFAITYVAGAVIDTVYTTKNEVDLSGSALSGVWVPTPERGFAGSGTFGEKDLFLEIMNKVYVATYDPIDKVMGAFKTTEFSLKAIAAIPSAIIFSILMVFCYISASLANIGFMMILLMHKVMTVFVTGMGPLIIALWTFKKTEHYAYSMFRFLLATGSVVIGASFLIGISMAVMKGSLESSGIFGINSEGEPTIVWNVFNDWIFSAKFAGFVGSYMILIIMILISVLVGISTVLAQRPNLEK